MLSSARLLLVSHDLSLSGAPLLACELAALLRRKLSVSLAVFEDSRSHPFLEQFCRRHEVERVELPGVEERASLLEHYDIVIVSTSVPAPWLKSLLAPRDDISRLLAARTVFWLHELDERYVQEETRRFVERVGYVVYDSHVCRESWRERSGGTLPTRRRVIHPAVADEFLTAAIDARAQAQSGEPKVRRQAPRNATRRELGIPEQAFVALAIGVLPHKGVREVVTAFGLWLGRLGRDRRETRPHLVLVGAEDGGEAAAVRADLEGWAADDARRVHLVPPTPSIGGYYAAADVLVVHSLPPGEAFGRVSIEAMAYALPVLATDCGGSVEVVLHRVTGWLHGTDDVTTLVDQLDHLRRHPELAAEFGAAGHRRVREVFDERRMERQWLEVLDDVHRADAVVIEDWQVGEEAGPGAPFAHMEAEACRVGDQLLLFGGFGRTYWDLNEGPCAVLDLPTLTWQRELELPPSTEGEIARSHGGICAGADGRVYVVSGQRGPRYAAAIHEGWSLDPRSGRWARLPDLPVARYCGALVEWQRQLHLFPGDLEDRRTPCAEHWILELDGPGGTPGEWTRGADRPVASDHFGAAFVSPADDPEGAALYLVGGEHGHAARAPGDDAEAPPGAYIAHAYAHRYDFATDRWTRLADLPVAVHHIEHQIVAIDPRYLLVLGGAGHGSATTDVLQLYDIETDSWQVLESRLPYPLIGAVGWFESGWVHLAGGQTAISAADPRPGRVLASMTRARVRILRHRRRDRSRGRGALRIAGTRAS